jgi:hypothetical protein
MASRLVLLCWTPPRCLCDIIDGNDHIVRHPANATFSAFSKATIHLPYATKFLPLQPRYIGQISSPRINDADLL